MKVRIAVVLCLAAVSAWGRRHAERFPICDAKHPEIKQCVRPLGHNPFNPKPHKLKPSVKKDEYIRRYTIQCDGPCQQPPLSAKDVLEGNCFRGATDHEKQIPCPDKAVDHSDESLTWQIMYKCKPVEDYLSCVNRQGDPPKAAVPLDPSCSGVGDGVVCNTNPADLFDKNCSIRDYYGRCDRESSKRHDDWLAHAFEEYLSCMDQTESEGCYFVARENNGLQEEDFHEHFPEDYPITDAEMYRILNERMARVGCRSEYSEEFCKAHVDAYQRFGAIFKSTK